MEENRKKRPFFATVALSNNFPYRSETSFLCRMSVSYVVKDRQIDFLVTRNIFFIYNKSIYGNTYIHETR